MTTPCPKCEGAGRVRVERTEQLRIQGYQNAGNKATVTFSDTARQPVGVPVSLQGFTAALNALK